MNRQKHGMSGVAMVEFAIVTPLLMTFFLAITEMGHALHQHNTLTKAVAVGARYMARSHDTLDVNCNPQGAWANHKTTANNLTIYGNTRGDGKALAPHLDDAAKTTLRIQVRANGGVCIISLELEMEYAPLFPGLFQGSAALFNLPSLKLMAATEERYIGE